MMGVIAIVNQETSTELEDDTPLYRKNLQIELGLNFIAATTRKDRIMRPLLNFVKKTDWEALKLLFGQYWYKIRI